MSERPSIDRALAWASRQLEAMPDPRREAEWLLMDILSCSRARLFSHADEYLADEDWQRFRAAVSRRAAGEPVAQILGYCEFRSLRLTVTPDVLIPRPETEWLVEAVLQELPGQGLSVVDLGTGSGAIALSLARERPDWSILATDLSPEALAVARGNARALGLERVQFALGDWFNAVPASLRFDAVISNPPYVESGSPVLDQSVARYEPGLALYADDSGLAALRLLVAGAAERLRPGGWLALEHGYDQGAAVRQIMRAGGYQDIHTHNDLGGLERFTMARWRGGSLA